ncbi:MAG: hypothetical protein HY761_09100 [Candidatus Omnitrophica bacterium]|nr:hypothetical protein [Candidatus Omnitrophota bacterium]
MRKAMAARIFVAVSFLFLLPVFSFCQTMNVDDLIGQYSKATEIERGQIEDTYRYKEISSNVTIKDVIDWATFDERTDKGEHFYKVVTEPQMSKAGIPYGILIFFKDKNKVEQFVKGQKIETTGSLIKIVDEVGSFSVWLYAGGLTPEDKIMFAQ